MATGIYFSRLVVTFRMSDKRHAPEETDAVRRSVPPGCPYRFIPDQLIAQGLPANEDPPPF